MYLKNQYFQIQEVWRGTQLLRQMKNGSFQLQQSTYPSSKWPDILLSLMSERLTSAMEKVQMTSLTKFATMSITINPSQGALLNIQSKICHQTSTPSTMKTLQDLTNQ